jgi:hypothetical protein
MDRTAQAGLGTVAGEAMPIDNELGPDRRSDGFEQLSGQRCLLWNVATAVDNFITHSAQHVLEVIDSRSTTFRTKHILIVSPTTAARFYVRRFDWTGATGPDEPLPEVVTEHDVWGTPKHKIHGPLVTQGIERIVVVDLGRTLARGEREKLVFSHTLKDFGGSFQRVLGVRPDAEESEIENLELTVTLPANGSVNVRYEKYQAPDHVLDVTKLEPTIDGDGRLSYSIKLPSPQRDKFGHRITWD